MGFKIFIDFIWTSWVSNIVYRRYGFDRMYVDIMDVVHCKVFTTVTCIGNMYLQYINTCTVYTHNPLPESAYAFRSDFHRKSIQMP